MTGVQTCALPIYDEQRKRERSKSAGTAIVGEGRTALDRLYLADTEHRVCPTCHRPWDHSGSPLLLTALSDYLILSEHKPGFRGTKNRIGRTGKLALCATAVADDTQAINTHAAPRMFLTVMSFLLEQSAPGAPGFP